MRPARGADLVAELRGPFVFLAAGGLLHLLLEPPEDRLVVARQEVREGLDLRAVGLLGDAGDLRHARPGAAPDVVVQAGPAARAPLVEEGVGAGADREHAGERVERLADRVGVSVGAEVADALALRPAHHLRARPRLPHRQRQVRIGLVVAVADVEPGPVRLDQVVLEHQGVDLGRGQDPLDALRPLDHRWVRGCSGRHQYEARRFRSERALPT